MNKPLLIKGFKLVFTGIICCFIAPVIVMQAFKNQNHPFFIPVLVVGCLGMIAAFFYGLKGVKSLVIALLGNRKKGEE